MNVNMETRIFLNENARRVAYYMYKKYPDGGTETIRITDIKKGVDLTYAGVFLDDIIMERLPCDVVIDSDYKTYIEVTVTY